MNFKFFAIGLLIFLNFLVGVKAQTGFPYCESFQTPGTQSKTIFGGNASLTGGVLRLTSNLNDQVGYVYIDVPFPSIYGIKAEFEYFSYGGTGQFLADGLTIFLFDGDTQNFSPGGFGGSLGYAPRNNESGLSNAYIGIGFDEFGNFGNSGEGRIGRFSNIQPEERVPDAIVVRGPGNGFQGYQFIVGRKTNTTGNNNDGLNPGAQFPISSGGSGTTRVTDPNQPGYRKVFLELEPNPNGVGFFLTLRMMVTTQSNQPRMVTIFDRPYDFPAPKNLKIGFAASTGGFTNFHEIRNLQVEVSNDDALENPIGIDFEDVATCEGQENQFFILDQDVVLPNVDSEIRCLQFYRTREEIQAQADDICTQARCLEQNRYLVLPEGILEAGEKGAYTFFPNEGFAGQEVTVFYTIGDNYGKASEGNKITLRIQESPEPVSLEVIGKEVVEGSINSCPGESLTFIASGNEEYTRYEWYLDGELIVNETSDQLIISEEGMVEVWAYNRNNCPAKSDPIEVVYPEYPELIFDELVVGCIPGEPVNIFEGISSYDPESFDYLLTGNGLELENEEISTLNQSGTYEVFVKPKEFDCYSGSNQVEVFIQEEELLIGYDFVVQGTDIRGDAEGGIFPDDPIQFTDMSDTRTIRWSWDFGDGETSQNRDPVHVFGKKGEFEVTLTLTDRFGCQKSLTKTISITKSFRVMFPTGFTPGLEENKTYTPKYKGLFSAELLIFNLWGDLIFQSNELNGAGWDGTIEGKLVDAGTYIYRFNGVSTEGEQVKESGKFKLIR
ncbi:PKD domain-containing protein [Algoriphagus algorifonticola]|uniref:PKD domain-containing protein n=1 Tax=Algoriphagus algorifonticola TaxID=2593007 RepID=UPI0011A40365|nr:PKD domain-containing protein [Algoriphagus algorifonticola]